MERPTFVSLALLAALPLVAQFPEQRPELPIPTESFQVSSTSKHSYTPWKVTQSNVNTSLTKNPEVYAQQLTTDTKNYFSVIEYDLTEDGEAQINPSASILILGEGNQVTLLSPLQGGYGAERVYLEGTQNGDEMRFQLPVMLMEDGAFTQKLSLLRYDTENETYLPVEDAENILIIHKRSDGSLYMHTSDLEPSVEGENEEFEYPEMILGIFSEDEEWGEAWWEGGCWSLEYTPVTLNSAPEGLEFEEWTLAQVDPQLIYKLYGWNRIAGVAIDGNDIYIKGITEYCEDSILKGTIENGIATFPGIQATGYSESINVIVYSVSAQATITESGVTLGDDIPLTMVLDLENKTLKSKDTMMLCIVNPEIRAYLNMWLEPKCIANTPEHLNADPIAPKYQLGMDMTSTNNGYFMNYYIPNINVNGCVLDKSKMYYNIYINGEILTLSKDKYFNIPEDMTDIPGDYTDNGLFISQVLAYGKDVYGLWLMFENYELYTMGVQSFYEGSDGTIYSSPLNMENPGFYEPEGTPSIQNGISLTETYYNLEGMKITNPSSGIFIRISTLSDGTQKVEKVKL